MQPNNPHPQSPDSDSQNSPYHTPTDPNPSNHQPSTPLPISPAPLGQPLGPTQQTQTAYSTDSTQSSSVYSSPGATHQSQPPFNGSESTFSHNQVPQTSYQSAKALQDEWLGQQRVSPTPLRHARIASSKKFALLLAAFGLVLVAGSVFAYVANSSRTPKTPDEAFQQSLVNALSTSSVTQTTKAGTDSATIKFDIEKPASPHVTADVSIGYGGQLGVDLSGYGSLQNTYAKVDMFKGVEQFPSQGLHKWIQIRQNGIIPTAAIDSSEVLSNYYDPRTALLGEYIFGNFSKDDRAALLSIITASKVYSYDTAKVSSERIGGQDTYVYYVTVQNDGLKKLNEKAASIFHIPASDVEDSVGTLLSGSPETATLYVSKSSDRLVRVATKYTTVDYTDFNHTKLPNEPKAAMQYSDFLKLSNGSSSGSIESGVQDKASDTARKTDLNSLDYHLETYHDQHGYYPTLAQLNDDTWFSQNMPGADSESRVDPQSSTRQLVAKPQKGAYSYEIGTNSNLASCASNATTCNYFRLTATLSDGTKYVKQSF